MEVRGYGKYRTLFRSLGRNSFLVDEFYSYERSYIVMRYSCTEKWGNKPTQNLKDVLLGI